MDETAALHSNHSTGKNTALHSSRTAKEYVSVFRINGAPILPPLMTAEKRRQMQKLREKAIRVEQRLKYMLRNGTPLSQPEAPASPPATPLSPRSDSAGSSGGDGKCNSSRSTVLETADVSCLILSSLMEYHKHTDLDKGSQQTPQKVCKDNSTSPLNKKEKMEQDTWERMIKLQRSDTIVYDNISNTIIMPMTKLEEEELHNQLQNQNQPPVPAPPVTAPVPVSVPVPVPPPRKSPFDLQEIEAKANLNYIGLESPRHLQFNNTKPIPSICVNPPTPLLPTRTFCAELKTIESTESIAINELKPETDEKAFSDETNDSCDSSDTNLKEATNNTNISSKIIQFENFQADAPAAAAAAASLPPQGLLVNKPQRSITSHSLKASSARSASYSRKSPNQNAHSPGAIVRSNSFTLEGPSMVLLEHIRQQQVNCGKTNNVNVNAAMPLTSPASTSQLAHRRPSPSPSAIRDTVESRAKRVQKVELKARNSPMQTRAVQKKSSSNSIHNCVGSAHASQSNSSMVHKNVKRSPYDMKASSKTKLSRPLKKTVSSTTVSNLKQVISRPSIPVVTQMQRMNLSKETHPQTHKPGHHQPQLLQQSSQSPPQLQTNGMGKELLAGIQAEHREKIMKLIADQQEEKKRMQEAFEAQQKQLLEQLSITMDNTKLQNAVPGIEKAQLPTLPTSPVILQSIPKPTYSLYRSPDRSFQFHLEGISVETSPNTKSDCSDFPVDKRSPTTSVNSSILSATNSYCGGISQREFASMDLRSTDDVSACSQTTNSSRYVARRRLFGQPLPGQPLPLECTAAGGVVVGLTAGASEAASVDHTKDDAVGVSLSVSRRFQQQLQNERRVSAATKINAFVRGYLVRRLFETEQIQRIVQTIRDTLIFVLNLHLETKENPQEGNTPANIKLKARLLQQLASASRTLHLVFFQTSVRERMEMIARDRKRIKTKLLALNMKRRSPRIVG